MNIDFLKNEFVCKAVRSTGPGGQHVNKVSSKVIVNWNLVGSTFFNEHEKQILLQKLSTRINKFGVLHLECDQTRSQFQNKELAIQRVYSLIQIALKVDKQRKATRVPKSVLKRRQEEKQKISQKKQFRKRIL
ncbi:alternative ribosome rescue aminoacyl-tRNA hydrolase ArfB [Myroides sp. LJL119]